MRLLAGWPALRAGELCYRAVIAARNHSYDEKQRRNELFRPAVPTISVGNVTVGGSGKTPVAIYLAGLLHERGRKAAIIARGYGAARGQLNDEMLLASRKCPDAVVLANPDRAAAIGEATRSSGADAVILDDAFQHRRVRRDLDIVLVDATRGFGNGHMLPAGPLREPLGSLGRADLVLLTRCEQAEPAVLEQLCRQIRECAGRDVPIGRTAMQVAGFRGLDLSEAAPPGGRAGLFAGIGNFGAFAQTCRQMGVQVAGESPLSDHCRYDAHLCQRFCDWAASHEMACLVTTEKDAVKLSRIDWKWPVPVRVLAIEVVPDEATRSLLRGVIDTALKR